MEKAKRPYVYRERPYDYRENLIREQSRKRKNRKQLWFSIENLNEIENKIRENNFADFSNYIRYCVTDKIISKDDIQVCLEKLHPNEKRKQICFDDDEIAIIKQRMEKLDCGNFNLFIRTLALK